MEFIGLRIRNFDVKSLKTQDGEIFQRVMADYRARQARRLGGLNDRLDI